MDSKLIARLIELIEQDIARIEQYIAWARTDFDHVDANDVKGQDRIVTAIAVNMRELAKLKEERHNWIMKG